MFQNGRETSRNRLEGGGKTSEDSPTIWMASLVAEYAVDFRLNLFLGAVPGSTVSSEDPVRFLFPVLKTDQIRFEAVERSVLRERGWLDESFGIKLFAYCWIPGHGRSRDRTVKYSNAHRRDPPGHNRAVLNNAFAQSTGRGPQFPDHPS